MKIAFSFKIWFLITIMLFCILFPVSPVFANRPSPQTDQFNDNQMARWVIYSIQVSPTIYNNSVILYNNVTHTVNDREAITDLAVTLFNSTLSIKSMLNYNDMSDLVFLTSVLSVETDYMRRVSSGSIEKEIRSMLFAGIKTSLGRKKGGHILNNQY